ncbi:hypothetical protein CLIM01_08112 [Colletotrichum limetticola]|uniref:Uncharacterized protein n=1 Tax=Colletotrichum limetticola TaxID=1209924 RepID=A0ABQ9PSN2_9PEZI|nr:hypothetical protein CLIM01_08112 [Colletotrichum limetticola]
MVSGQRFDEGLRAQLAYLPTSSTHIWKLDSTAQCYWRFAGEEDKSAQLSAVMHATYSHAIYLHSRQHGLPVSNMEALLRIEEYRVCRPARGVTVFLTSLSILMARG